MTKNTEKIKESLKKEKQARNQRIKEQSVDAASAQRKQKHAYNTDRAELTKNGYFNRSKKGNYTRSKDNYNNALGLIDYYLETKQELTTASKQHNIKIDVKLENKAYNKFLLELTSVKNQDLAIQKLKDLTPSEYTQLLKDITTFTERMPDPSFLQASRPLSVALNQHYDMKTALWEAFNQQVSNEKYTATDINAINTEWNSMSVTDRSFIISNMTLDSSYGKDFIDEVVTLIENPDKKSDYLGKVTKANTSIKESQLNRRNAQVIFDKKKKIKGKVKRK